MKNIHGRINQRANMSNKQKAFGLNEVALFKASFNFISAKPMFDILRRYEMSSNYNNHVGFYN